MSHNGYITCVAIPLLLFIVGFELIVRNLNLLFAGQQFVHGSRIVTTSKTCKYSIESTWVTFSLLKMEKKVAQLWEHNLVSWYLVDFIKIFGYFAVVHRYFRIDRISYSVGVGCRQKFECFWYWSYTSPSTMESQGFLGNVRSCKVCPLSNPFACRFISIVFCVFSFCSTVFVVAFKSISNCVLLVIQWDSWRIVISSMRRILKMRSKLLLQISM